LRSQGVGFPGFAIRRDRTVTEGPDARPLGNLQIFVDEDPASLFRASNVSKREFREVPAVQTSVLVVIVVPSH
jgi:hypothetical protein